MRTPEQWLADQIGDRPDDFAPDEMAMPLSWIASIQADARERLVAALKAIEANDAYYTDLGRANDVIDRMALIARNALKDAP